MKILMNDYTPKQINKDDIVVDCYYDRHQKLYAICLKDINTGDYISDYEYAIDKKEAQFIKGLMEKDPKNWLYDSYELLESLNEDNNYGYHAGDLGKSEQRERQTGGRGTGHFGTGTYFVGNPDKIKGYNDFQYGKGEAPHHIVDFSSYNLYKPSNNFYGYKLHDTLKELNNGYKYYSKYGNDYEWFMSKNLTASDSGNFEVRDIPEIVSHLNNLLSYNLIELPKDIDWNTIEDEYEKEDDRLYNEFKDKYKDEDGHTNYSKLFDVVEDELDKNPKFKEKNEIIGEIRRGIESELRSSDLDNYKRFKKLQDRLNDALEHRHSKEEIANALNEVNKHLDDKTGDSLSTIFMKALGYDGVDVRHLNKDSDGWAGLDNTTYGSVIYDVKPETIVEDMLVEMPKFANLKKLPNNEWLYKENVKIGYNSVGKYYFVIEPDSLNWMYSNTLSDLIKGIKRELNEDLKEVVYDKDESGRDIFYNYSFDGNNVIVSPYRVNPKGDYSHRTWDTDQRLKPNQQKEYLDYLIKRDEDELNKLITNREKEYDEPISKLKQEIENAKRVRDSFKINESLDTFTFPNLRQAIDYYWKDRNANIEKVSIQQLVDDNNLLDDDDLQSYHQRQWDNKKAKEFSIDKGKVNSMRLSEVPYAVRHKDGKLELGDGRHRTRALYNDGYKFVEMPVLTEKEIFNSGDDTTTINEEKTQNSGNFNIQNVFHGGPHTTLHPNFKSTLWFSEDFDYALDFGENIFICNLSIKNMLDVGNTDGYIRGLIPTQFNLDFTNLAHKLNLEPKDLLKIDRDAKNIYTIVRTKEFRDLCVKNGYDGIKTIEEGNVCYGVFDLSQVEVVDTDFEDEENLLVANGTNKFDETLVYHGTDNDFDDFEEGRINWFTTDENYAKQYGQKILKRDIDTSDFIDIGEINQYLDYVDDDDYDKDGKLIVDYSNTFVPKCLKELADKIGVDVDELISIYNMEHLSEYEDENGITFLTDSLYDITNSLYFYNLLKENNIKGIIASEGGITTYGVADKSTINKLTEDLSQEVDSEGNPLTPEQVKFFKNSKVRDDKGRLLVVYHGTDAEFDVFDRDKIGNNTHNYGFYGKGFYFSNSSNYAREYSKEGKTKAYYLNISNPFYWNNYRTLDDFNEIKQKLNLNNEITFTDGYSPFAISTIQDKESANKFTQSLIENNYNGVIFNYGDDLLEIVAFNPNQIKSIDNKNPSNSNNINENKLNESLHKATPYMLRNDEQVFECKGWHPYISNIYDNKEDNLDSLINERLWELEWYYNNTLNKNTKNLIRILINSCCNKQLNLTNEQKLKDMFNVSDDTYTCRDDNELYSILENLNNETNQEFCKVRTSDIKFGGNSNDIYFRISSIGFNWFDLIWKFVMRNSNNISSVTISRDTRVRDFSQGECYKIKGKEINHMSTEEFLTLSGNPILENYKCKLNIINKAIPKLKIGKSLNESYPNLHPKDINGFYNRQVKEELNWDINNILQPSDVHTIEDKGDYRLHTFKGEYSDQYVEEYKTLKGIMSRIMDNFINNKDYMTDDMTLYIEYKDGSTYYLGGSFDDGKFKKTGIKNVIIDDGTYAVYGDWIPRMEGGALYIETPFTNKGNEQIDEALTTDNYYRYEILKDGKLVGGLFKGYIDIMDDLKEFLPSFTALFNDIGKEIPKPDVNYDGYDSDLIRSAFTENGVKKFENALKTIKDEFTKNNIKLVKKKVNPDEDAIIYGDDYQIVYYDDMANVEPLD